MPESDPLVSVLLPTRDRAALLPRAIASLQAQTYARWELLIVDDGSTDGTGRLAGAFQARDERIRYFRQDPLGTAAARNRGLASAAGKYVACLDSDDEYLPSHLAERVRYMENHPATALIHGGAVVIGPPEMHFVPDARDRTRRIAIDDCVVGGTFFLLGDVLREAGGWREMYAEDLDLYDRIATSHPTARVGFRTYLYHRDAPGGRCEENALGR